MLTLTYAYVRTYTRVSIPNPGLARYRRVLTYARGERTPNMVETEVELRRALRILKARNPTALDDLITIGEMEEPFCGVCSCLLGIVRERLPGWRAAIVILTYHDEPLFDTDEACYLRAIGLGNVFMYMRCQNVYRMAAKTKNERTT